MRSLSLLSSVFIGAACLSPSALGQAPPVFSQGPFTWPSSCVVNGQPDPRAVTVKLNVYSAGTAQQPLQRWEYTVSNNFGANASGLINFYLNLPDTVLEIVRVDSNLGFAFQGNGPIVGWSSLDQLGSNAQLLFSFTTFPRLPVSSTGYGTINFVSPDPCISPLAFNGSGVPQLGVRGNVYVPGPALGITLTQTRKDFRPRAAQDDPVAHSAA